MSPHDVAPVFWTPILYDVAHALESVEAPEIRIDRVLALMRRFVPYDRCALLEANPVLRRTVSVAPDMSAEERDALAGRLVHMLELLSEEDLESMRRLAAPRLAQHHLAVPIIGLGETTGIILVERSASAYDESHLAFLSVIAAQIGAYLAAVRADRELRASEARFRGLYESGIIGITFMDAVGTLTEANQTFADMVGRSRAELRSGVVNWHDMTPPEHLELDRAAIQDAVKRGSCMTYEKRIVRKDGRPVTVVAGAARLDSPDSLVAFALDISDQKRIETERAGLLEARESDLQLLEMFVGMLGHDLRNPLHAIRMSAQLLRLGGGERPEDTINRILSSTERMSRLVEQLLDLTRIRLAGGMPVDPKPVDLGEICGRVMDELTAAHPDAKIHFEVRGDVTGRWDADRLLQGVSNLLANAIENARGSRQITLRVSGTDRAVAFVIHNPGAIPEDLLPVLFDPFRGTQAPGVRKGLGLGLFITKHIVEAHGGSMEVESAEPRGTTFRICLPRTHARIEGNAAEHGRPSLS